VPHELELRTGGDDENPDELPPDDVPFDDVPLDGVAIEPPPSERPSCASEETPDDGCDELDAAAPGCACRATPSTTRNPPAAVRATARLAAAARLRPASTRETFGMSPLSRQPVIDG
jgi:hypothetical protein